MRTFHSPKSARDLRLASRIAVCGYEAAGSPVSTELLVDSMSEDAAPTVAHFMGQVHPLGFGWSMDNEIGRELVPGQVWTFQVHACKFVVTVSPMPVGVDLNTLKNEALEFARSCLDALGFCIGAVLTPELTGAVLPGASFFVEPCWRDVVDVGQDRRVGPERLYPLLLATRNQAVRLALADVALAMDRPEDTGFYAYRAVECIRQHFVDPAAPEDKSLSWQRLRSSLSVEREDLSWLKAQANGRRHGQAAHVPVETRLRALGIARKVVDSFVAYLGAITPPEQTPESEPPPGSRSGTPVDNPPE